MNRKNENTNTLKISENVIAKIVEIAVKGVDGVSSLTKSRVNFGHLFSPDIPSAIDVHTENGSIDVTVSVIVLYSSKVRLVAEHIQQRVKEDIQNMTGIAVTKVNVIVDGIDLGCIPSKKETADN